MSRKIKSDDGLARAEADLRACWVPLDFLLWHYISGRELTLVICSPFFCLSWVSASFLFMILGREQPTASRF